MRKDDLEDIITEAMVIFALFSLAILPVALLFIIVSCAKFLLH